jgi:hypothetical protein
MAIKLFADHIEIGNFILTEGNQGIQFDGVINADRINSNPYQGVSAGYTVGQYGAPQIGQFPFATYVTQKNPQTPSFPPYSRSLSGGASNTHGYQFGHYQGGSPPLMTTIEKFPFADVTAPAVATGALKQNTGGITYFFKSSENAYIDDSPTIAKIPWATDQPSVPLPLFPGSTNLGGGNGVSSSSHGYGTGQYSASSVLKKFPFASENGMQDLGQLMYYPGFSRKNCSSPTNGYALSGQTYGPAGNAVLAYSMERFPFAQDTSGKAVLIGSLGPSTGVWGITHSSRTTGHWTEGTIGLNTFPFATDASATQQQAAPALAFGTFLASSHVQV